MSSHNSFSLANTLIVMSFREDFSSLLAEHGGEGQGENQLFGKAVGWVT